MAPTGQGGQWQDVLCCTLCNKMFNVSLLPVNLICGHVICRRCATSLPAHRKPCPNDDWAPTMSLDKYPTNVALLSIIMHDVNCMAYSHAKRPVDSNIDKCMIEMATLFRRAESERGGSVYSQKLSRTLQRKVISLMCYQWTEEEGRNKCVKTCRAIAERIMIEVLLNNQSNSHVSSQLWTAVRARGCQFLGPAMQEDVLHLILITLESGELIARKNLVMYVVTTLSSEYPQVSKTCVGHVVQLLYRASCFNVLKRDGESSLMQLKEEFRTYEALRREHDSQIVQMALEAGLRIGPDQWSALLYADQGHRSHMQSIIDKLQSPNSYAQCMDELKAAINSQTMNPSCRAMVMDMLPLLNSIEEGEKENNDKVTVFKLAIYLQTLSRLIALHTSHEERRRIERNQARGETDQTRRFPPSAAKFKTRMCPTMERQGLCERGNKCSFAHSLEELRESLLKGSQPVSTTPTQMNSINVYGQRSFENVGQMNQRPVPPGPPHRNVQPVPMQHQQRGPPQQPMHLNFPPMEFQHPNHSAPLPPPPPQFMIPAPHNPPPHMMGPPTPGPPGQRLPPGPPPMMHPHPHQSSSHPPPNVVNGGPPPPTVLISFPVGQPPSGAEMTMMSGPVGQPGMPPLQQGNGVTPNHPPPPNGTMMIMSSPTHMQPGQMVMMQPTQPPVVITNPPPPPQAGGPPPPPPSAIWAAPSPGGPGGNIMFQQASPPHPTAFWIQPTEASIFNPFDFNVIWGSSMRDSGQDAEQLLMKRNEILNRLAPPLSIDDDDCEDCGIGHVSYTVASSVLDDSRMDGHHPLLLSLKPVQTIELPAIPVSFSGVPTEETMTIIGDLVQSRPRAPSLTQTTTTMLIPRHGHHHAEAAQTVQSDCSTMSVMDSICQPIATPAIQKTTVSSTNVNGPMTSVVTTLPPPEAFMGPPPGAIGPGMGPGGPVPQTPVPGAPQAALIVDGATGLLTPVMRPILMATYPQEVVSNSLDKIVDVKERLSEAQGNASEAENAHLRMELRMAESEMAHLDPYTKNNCLLRELQQVDRELQQLHIEPSRQ